MSVARSIGGEDRGQATSMRKVGVAAFIGALVEWYDYFLYGLGYWPVALYVMAAGLISFVSVYLATESFREDLTKELTRERGASKAGQAN